MKNRRTNLKTLIAFLSMALVFPVASHLGAQEQAPDQGQDQGDEQGPPTSPAPPEERPERPERDRPDPAISDDVRESIADWREAHASLVESYAEQLADEELTEEERAQLMEAFREDLSGLREEHLADIPEAAQALRRDGQEGRTPNETAEEARAMRDAVRAFHAEIEEERAALREQLQGAETADERRAVLEQFRESTAERREELVDQRRQMQESVRDRHQRGPDGDDG